VVTTDILTEGIHFNLIYTPLKHLGYKAVTVNLSDVYAMNCEPKQILVSIAFSSKFSLEHIEKIYEGIKLACDNYKVDLVGGDTSSSLTGLTISITAIGTGEKGKDYIPEGCKSK
jgi:thiamine-monophosphate kinase